jgi:glycosyltransferase involved in cell wall biosynthesis
MTVFLVGLESHEQRYTGEWGRHLPVQLQKHVHEPVVTIAGTQIQQAVTPGAFLNFAGTNVFKAQQVEQIAASFQCGNVKAGDTFLFADAWHFGIPAVRYMGDLLKIPVRIVALWHAGQYDPHDFLGRIENRQWAAHFEKSIFAACDVNVFATEFHVDMFMHAHELGTRDRILRAGWPMEYLQTELARYREPRKRRLVLFPHRLAPEKQVEIFRDLALAFPDHDFRVCQDSSLTKEEYHALLAQAAAVFSASLQETLGIGLYEGLLCGAMPIAPDRLSYGEIYPPDLLYPSGWTESWQAYQAHKHQFIAHIRRGLSLADADGWQTRATTLAGDIGRNFFDGSDLYAAVRSSIPRIPQ